MASDLESIETELCFSVLAKMVSFPMLVGFRNPEQDILIPLFLSFCLSSLKT